MKRYWFSDSNYDLVGEDVIAGNVRPVKKYTQTLANELGQSVCINLGEDIVDWVYPEEC